MLDKLEMLIAQIQRLPHLQRDRAIVDLCRMVAMECAERADDPPYQRGYTVAADIRKAWNIPRPEHLPIDREGRRRRH